MGLIVDILSLLHCCSVYPVVEQRKRDRLLAYALVDLLGDYLVPITSPDQQRPAYVLATPLSYPQVRSIIWAISRIKLYD